MSVSAQVQEYLTRFESIPDMLELDHLTVSGDVTFGKNVSLKVNVDFQTKFYRKYWGGKKFQKDPDGLRE